MKKENLDTTFSSLWLFRANNFHGNKFNNIILEDPIGNITRMNTIRVVGGVKYFSKFNPILADNIISYWSEKGSTILDPFSGRTRAIVSAIKERNYYGFEIAKEVYNVVLKAIGENKDKLNIIPTVYNEDSYNLDSPKYDEIKADLIFSCPPYFNIESYPSCEGQLSDIKKYPEFLSRLKDILLKACNHLKDNGYAIMVAGDFRINGKLYCFHNDLINIMNEIGMRTHDVIVNQTVTYNRAAHRFGACRKTKITAKVHEYILVFKK